MRNAAWCYVAFIVYASLYPFSGWRAPTSDLLGFLTDRWPEHLSKSDVVANVLAYIPLGLLLALPWRRRRFALAPLLLATLFGAALSFLMEFVQEFLPSRVPSAVDLLTNSCGAFIGGVLAVLARGDGRSSSTLASWRERWVKPGRLFELGLIPIGVWALSQLAPLVPSLDIGKLRDGLAPIALTLRYPETFDFMHAALYALDVAGLALVVRTLAAPGQPATALFFAATGTVLLLKVLMAGRQLSLEAVCGACAGALVALSFRGLRARATTWVSASLIIAGFVCYEIEAGPDFVQYGFNWVPFRPQLENPLIGLWAMLEYAWPAAALAYLVRFATRPHHHTIAAWGGGVGVFIGAFALEWHQQFVFGRYGDATEVLLMTAVWILCWRVPLGKEQFAGSIGRHMSGSIERLRSMPGAGN